MGIDRYSIARQRVWRSLQRGPDGYPAVPHGQEERVFAKSARAQKGQLDGVPDGVATVQRLRDLAELVC
jgi:hypothetical protein